MRAALVGFALLLAAGACSSGSIGDGASNGGGFNDPGRPGNGSSGPGGPGANPGGGSTPGGGGNAGGMGPGSPPSVPATPAPDAGAGADGGASMPPGAGVPGCQVIITALNPPRLENLLAGSTSRLRIQARVTGTQAPATPAWQWQVQLVPLSDVTVNKLTPEGDIVEFPLAAEGFYNIQVSAGPMCANQVTARAFRPDQRVTTYWARVTPSLASKLAPGESQIMLGGPPAPPPVISLSRGVTVAIDPQNAQGQAIRSYIRISSPISSVRFEGNNLSQPFTADLATDRPYDVLIVPEGTDAPVLLAGRTASQLQTERFMFDPGLSVTGTIRRAQAAAMDPVVDARVFLRAGNLPSSIGKTTASGDFELRARDGAFQVSVLPATDSGLPEARLPEGTSYSPATQGAALQFTYAAVRTAAVEVTVRSSDGQRPVANARVRLDADPASLGAIGSFRLPPDDREVPAAGALRVEATTKVTGAASFARLPFGRYRALVAPPAGMADAATTVATIEVRAGMAPPAINLVRPVKLTGRLLSTAPLSTAGLKLLAIEVDGPSPGEALSATSGEIGQFSFSVAPGRTYRLQIEPAQERKLPRLFLGPHTAGMVDSVYGDVTLSEGVLFTGVVTNGSAPVADAVVQIFCTGAPPDCMAPVSPQLDSARPLAETRAGADGTFRVYLPNPASWDL